MANNRDYNYPFCEVYINYLRLLKLYPGMRFSDFFNYINKSKGIIHRQLKQLEKDKYIILIDKKYYLSKILVLYAKSRKLGLEREFAENMKTIEVFTYPLEKRGVQK